MDLFWGIAIGDASEFTDFFIHCFQWIAYTSIASQYDFTWVIFEIDFFSLLNLNLHLNLSERQFRGRWDSDVIEIL